jgi:hypothetical protein
MYKKKDSKKDTFTKSKIPSVRHFSSRTASSARTWPSVHFLFTFFFEKNASILCRNIINVILIVH